MPGTHFKGPLFVAGVEIADENGNIDAPVTTTNLTTSGNTTLGDNVADTLIMNSRFATASVAGAALTFSNTYTYGEAVEWRFTSSKTDNSQFQGLFASVRTSAANSSTIRGCEMKAEQDGAVAVGVLEGGNFSAVTRSATSGNITSMFGLTGEVTHNSNAYTGTVTNLAAVRGKVSLEDGTTYTNSSVFLAESEPISGADVLGSILRCSIHASVTVTSVIDAADTAATNFLKVTATGKGGATVGAMTKSPENDPEDGYLTILIGATSYQIPFYAA